MRSGQKTRTGPARAKHEQYPDSVLSPEMAVFGSETGVNALKRAAQMLVPAWPGTSTLY